MNIHFLNFITKIIGCYKRGIGIILLALFMLPSISFSQLVPASTCAENVNNQVTVVAAGACTWPNDSVYATVLTGPLTSACSTAGVFTAGWLWFIATSSTTIIADSSNRDIVLWVYSGTCGSLTEIGCSDLYLSNSNAETVTVQTIVGNHYYIRVGRKYVGVFGFNSWICVSSPPPPANDGCGGAIVLTPSTSITYVSATNSGATPSVTAPAPTCGIYSGNDVWYKVTVPAGANGGPMNFDTQPGQLVFPNPNLTNADMAIYTGTCPGGLTQVACDDSSSTNPGHMPAITIPVVTTGVVYYIRIWANNLNSSGSFKICAWYPPPVPCNAWDNPCTTPITLAVNSSCVASATFNNTCATPTANVATPTCAISSYFGGDVWFKVIVPIGGKVIIQGLGVGSGQGTMADGMMALYIASTCSGPFTELYCDDNSGLGNDPEINASGLIPGNTLYIRFWGSMGTSGTFKLCCLIPTPCNLLDEPCYTSTTLTVNTSCIPATYNNICATATPNISTPSCATDSGVYQGGDVWFKAIVPTNGQITFQTDTGTMVDGMMALYTGTCGNLIEVTCNDDAGPTTMPVIYATGLVSGTTVYLRFWGYYGETGTFKLCAFTSCTPPAFISALGSTTFCQGNNVILNANTGTGLSYQWKLNGTNIIGATQSSYSATATGSYTCAITSTCGNAISNAISVTVNPLPGANITPQSSTSICSGGGSVNLNANTGVGLTYQWKLNNATINGATSSIYTASAAGSYAVVVSNTFCSSTSTPVIITVNPLPAATITASGATTFCSGDSAVLNAFVATNRLYQWKKGGSNIAGATLSSYAAKTSGTYKVIVTNTITGCSKTSAVGITITVNPLPTATITANGPTTFCAGDSVILQANTGIGLTYQWKKGINLLAGATNLSYAAKTGGTYRVIVTNSNNCSKTSTGTLITINCRISNSNVVNNIESEVFPNPTSGTITLRFHSNKTEKGQLIITDITGRELASSIKSISEGSNNLLIDLNGYAKGIYVIKLKISTTELINRIIKE